MAKKLKVNLKVSIFAFAVCLVGGALLGGYFFDSQEAGAFIGLVVGVVVAAFLYVL